MIISGAMPDNSIVSVEDTGPAAPKRLAYIVTPGEAPISPTAMRNGSKRGRPDLMNKDDDEDDEDMITRI